MPSMTISRQIFGCLLLILLSQYGDTKSHHLESILAAITRIERIIEQVEQNGDFGCIVPCKLLNAALDLPRLPEAGYRALSPRNPAVRKALLSGHDIDNMNANININGAHGYEGRRNFGGSVLSSNKIANQNVNMFDELDENDAKANKFEDYVN